MKIARKILYTTLVTIIIILAAVVFTHTQNKQTNDNISSNFISKKRESNTKEEISKTIDSASSNSESRSSTDSQMSSSFDNKRVSQIWTDDKNEQLNSFMLSWGKTMGQTYKSYDSNQNVNYMGVRYPNEFIKNTTAVDGYPVSIEWSTDGSGDKDYEVVAIYSDAEQQSSSPIRHLYLFTIHQGNSIVLVTMQNQGTPDHLIHFSQTQNKELSTNFERIFRTH